MQISLCIILTLIEFTALINSFIILIISKLIINQKLENHYFTLILQIDKISNGYYNLRLNFAFFDWIKHYTVAKAILNANEFERCCSFHGSSKLELRAYNFSTLARVHVPFTSYYLACSMASEM